MTNQLFNKITVVVKTFERPDLIKRCVRSIRALYPKMPIVIADDSRTPTLFDDDPFTEQLSLPYDSGISYGRNRALERVNTPYYLLIDDDHCLEKDSNLEELVSVLETTELDIISLRMIDYRAGKNYSRGELIFAGTMNIEDGVFIHRVGVNRGKHFDFPLYDLVLNCYLAKKASTAQISFDEEIKIGKEHGDYFLQAKSIGLKISVAKNSYIHHRPVYSREYNVFRKRSGDFESVFFKKYDIKSEDVQGSYYYIPSKFKYYLDRVFGLFSMK